jgi:hypothetical protein
MKNTKISGPAVFMYTSIAVMIVLSSLMLTLYYSGRADSGIVKWTGIVAFMILYHFGMRILMGEVNKLWKISYKSAFFRPLKFEKRLYSLLRVRLWRDKVLTFRPDEFLMSKNTLDDIANTMAKVEIDHWTNEIISVSAVFFSLLWGAFPVFLVSSALAMLFDAQFIALQRFNRPHVVRLIEARDRKKQSKIEV